MAKTYDVVQAGSIQLLMEEVNRRLEDGWELAGNFQAVPGPGFVQPMTTGKTVKEVKEGKPAKDLTDAEAHAEFLKQAESADNKAKMTQITGPVPVLPGINEPMQIEVVATPVAEVQAKEKAATEVKVKK